MLPAVSFARARSRRAAQAGAPRRARKAVKGLNRREIFARKRVREMDMALLCNWRANARHHATSSESLSFSCKRCGGKLAVYSTDARKYIVTSVICTNVRRSPLHFRRRPSAPWSSRRAETGLRQTIGRAILRSEASEQYVARRNISPPGERRYDARRNTTLKEDAQRKRAGQPTLLPLSVAPSLNRLPAWPIGSDDAPGARRAGQPASSLDLDCSAPPASRKLPIRNR